MNIIGVNQSFSLFLPEHNKKKSQHSKKFVFLEIDSLLFIKIVLFFILFTFDSTVKDITWEIIAFIKLAT